MGYLLGVDVGTSATKALVVSPEGEVRSSASVSYGVETPRPGWTEQQPGVWWRATVRAVRTALRAGGVSGGEVDAVGLTGQMHGAVFLDRRDRVIRPCILWNDQRTAEECGQIEERIGRRRLMRIACNPALAGFTAPKILWLRNHEPKRFSRLHKVLLPKDYIRLLMTGRYATDVSDASGTLLLDVRGRRWSREILGGLELDEALLPAVLESPEVSGRLRDEAAEELGLSAGAPVVAGAGDCAASAVGNGVISPGLVLSSLGTSGVVFAPCDRVRVDPRGRVHTFCHAVPGTWHVMGVVLSAGGAFQWFVERFSDFGWDGDPFERVAAEAERVPPGCEGLFFLPYLSGERTPHADPSARGAWVGLNLRHTRAHLARAVMEGVVFALRDCYEIVLGMGLPVKRIIVTGGGARSALWRQLQADIYGRTVYRLETMEGPALGAALLAGVGVGVWRDVGEACRAACRIAGRTGPRPCHSRLYRRLYAEYVRLYPALRDTLHRLSALA